MKAAMYILDFVIILIVSMSIGSEYNLAVAMAVFIALSHLHEIKEAVQKGAEQ